EQIAVEVRVISVPKGFGEKVARKVISAGKCEPSCSDVVVTAKETDSGSVLFGTGVNSDAGLSGSIGVNEESSCPGCCAKSCQDSKSAAKFSLLSDKLVQKFMDCMLTNRETNMMMAP